VIVVEKVPARIPAQRARQRASADEIDLLKPFKHLVGLARSQSVACKSWLMTSAMQLGDYVQPYFATVWEPAGGPLPQELDCGR
jgi:hypothetical protein